MTTIYSHSRLSTYTQCPRKYKFKYVELFPIGDRQSVEAYMGKTVHEALRRLYELVMAGNVWTEEKLLGYYDDIWDKEKPSEIYIRDEELTEDDFRKKGRGMLSDYYRMYRPFDQEKTVALERNITVNLDQEGVYRFQGFIDRLAVTRDGMLQIHDYKTARSMVRQQDLDEDRQLAMYQLGVSQMWPDREGFELVWHYLAVPEKRTSRRTELDIDSLVQETIGLIREIKQAHQDDNFPTHETRLCNWCEYMSFCPAKIHPLEISAKDEQDLQGDELVAVVDRMVEIKRFISELQNESEAICVRLARYAREKGVTVLAGTDRNVNIRFNNLYKPKYALLTDDKELEKRKFVGFLVRTGMIEEIFSYHAMSFDSFVKKAKFDSKFRDELFSQIETVEQKPIVTVTKKRD